MSLTLQIQGLLVSFLFGCIFSLLFNLSYHILFMKKKWERIFSNLLFGILMALGYFLLLKKMNDGILHPYFFFPFCLGFFLLFPKTKKLRMKKHSKEKDDK